MNSAVGWPALGRALAMVGMIAVLAAAAPAPAQGANSLDLEARYNVDARLEFRARRLHVTSDATVTNTTSAAVAELSFNLVPLKIGRAQVTQVLVGGQPADRRLDDQTITVTLPRPLAAGAAVVVRIAYSATFNSDSTDKNWLFTKRNRIATAYRWIPWLSRPVRFDRPNIGDPFTTTVSPEVRVSITPDRELIFGTSGRRVAKDGRRQTFVAHNVRDFNFAASPRYQVTRGRVDGIRVRVLTINQPARGLMKWSKTSLAYFGQRVGPYPYSHFTVAETPPRGTMESPAMIWIATDVGSTRPYLVAHETAHQWFYAILGNDQVAEPFADEAPTDFLTRDLLNSRRGSRCERTQLDLTIYDYQGACYYEVIYIQGGNYLDDYRRRVGDERFWAGMRAYYERYRFGMGGSRQLLDVLDEFAAPDGGGHEQRFPRLYQAVTI